MTARDDIVRRPPASDDEFPTATTGDWTTAAERSLGGGRITELDVDIAGGVVVLPLYTAEDAPEPSGYPGLAPYSRGGSAIRGAIDGWRPCLRCDHPDPAVAASWISDGADHGIDSVWIAFDRAARAGLAAGDAAMGDRPVDGLVISAAADLAPVLAAAGGSSIHVDGGGNGIALAAAAIATRRDRITASIGWDPLAALAADGMLPYGLDRSLELLADAAAWVEGAGCGITAVTVSTLPYVAAGASPVDELACAAATGVEYLRRLTTAGLDLEVVCRRIEFRTAVGLDVFGEIAKLRALRRIWSRVVESCGGDTPLRRAPIHAVTSPRWLTRRDPWVNMLRGTTAAFAAVAGGAELVTVLPFDAALGTPDAFGRRIAANVHAIMREESHLGRILDPGGGSYFIERLTEDLARAAWSRFQDLERAGGMVAVLVDGSLARHLSESDRATAAEIASRHRPITGVSWFADLAEIPIERPSTAREDLRATARRQAEGPNRQLEAVRSAAEAARGDGSVLEAAVTALEAGASIGEIASAIRGAGTATEIEPLPARRDSEEFESLRDASDTITAHTGTRPRAFVVGVGNASGQRSCLDLARGVLAAGGIETVAGPPAGDVEADTAAFVASGADIACICVADGHDPDGLSRLASALRAAGARSVAAVVGRRTSAPGCRKAAVDHALREGEEVVGVLASLLAACGGVDG